MSENRYLKWISGNTQSIYWHDSAIRAEQEEAFSNGACGMTTNPFLIYSTLRNDTPFWKERLSALPRGVKGDEKAVMLTRCVTEYFAEQVMPIYKKGEPGKGFVCAQTNPNKTGDADYMFEQAKQISSWAPNMVIKLPATRAGIEVYEECTALGMNVAATLSYTVPQVLAVGEARARGKARAERNGMKPGLGIAVMMVGRLDDYLRDVAHDSYPEVDEYCIIQAGTACFKRAYQIYKERGYDAYLMPAGSRGAHNIINIAGAKMIMSIAPRIAGMLKDVHVFEERIDVPADTGIIDRLMKMGEFRKAYEPDGMKQQDFIAYGATNRTTTQYIETGWNLLEEFQY